MKKYLVISGPNLNLLGQRKTSIYGGVSLAEIHEELGSLADKLGVEVETFQSNSEGEIIDKLQESPETCDGIIINAGALAHYSYSLRSALGATLLPCVSVQMSNVFAREEEFRHESAIASVCVGSIGGFGMDSYLLALEALVNLTKV